MQFLRFGGRPSLRKVPADPMFEVGLQPAAGERYRIPSPGFNLASERI